MCLSPPPSWPAVICKDPEEDWELVETDEDKDKIHMYHVIFLGKTKSRAWVPDDKVRVAVCAVGVRAWVPEDKVCVDVCAVGVGGSLCSFNSFADFRNQNPIHFLCQRTFQHFTT